MRVCSSVSWLSLSKLGHLLERRPLQTKTSNFDRIILKGKRKKKKEGVNATRSQLSLLFARRALSSEEFTVNGSASHLAVGFNLISNHTDVSKSSRNEDVALQKLYRCPALWDHWEVR